MQEYAPQARSTCILLLNLMPDALPAAILPISRLGYRLRICRLAYLEANLVHVPYCSNDRILVVVYQTRKLHFIGKRCISYEQCKLLVQYIIHSAVLVAVFQVYFG